MAYVHSKKADEPSKEVREITEIRRVIVRPERVADDPVQPEELPRIVVEPGAVPAAPPALAPDPVASARSRLDKMRGVH
jgi:hypothetical protein